MKPFHKIFSLQNNSIFIQKVSICWNSIQIQSFNKNMFPSNFDARIIPYRNIKNVLSNTQPLVHLFHKTHTSCHSMFFLWIMSNR